MSGTYRHDPVFLKAVETLIQTIQFDVNGTAGKGGNGGLTSDKAIRQSGELHIMMDRIKKLEATFAINVTATIVELEACPICEEPFKPSDLCATDITMGTCHAECLDGSPVVSLDTGEETGGEVHLYHYIVDAPPAPLPQTFVATHRHKARGSTYQLIGGATIQTDGKLADMDAVVIYRNEDGTLWARSPSEFFDGRFGEISTEQEGAA